jgi:hypothetical protein
MMIISILEYYPHPDSFEPERFDTEHGGVKEFKDKFVLLPFGLGPRVRHFQIIFSSYVIKTFSC